MKRPILLFPLLAIVMLLAIMCLFLGLQQSPTTESSRTDLTLSSGEPSEKQGERAPAANSTVSGSTSNRRQALAIEHPDALSAGESDQPTKPTEDGFVIRTLSETWTDPVGKPDRRRVRIVEADFKYPFLRLEESVTAEADGGEPTVTLLRASVADHLIVGIPAAGDGRVEARAIAEAGHVVRAIEPGSFILVEVEDFAGAGDQEASIRRLSALDEFIDFAEPDWLVHPAALPDDPAVIDGKLWGLHNTGSVAGTRNDADIDAPEGWNIRSAASNVVVAVTDTGVRYTHEDLAPNMWSNASGHHGFDAYDDDNDPMDVGGHGTHCAGTIGARGDNGVGIAGVAWDVRLMALRFLGPNGGTSSDAVRVLNYARLNGADVISASWGGSGESTSLLLAIEACYGADIPIVAAAGNNRSDNDSMPFYPASYDTPNIVSVASTDSTDQLSYFSNFGRTNVDLAAPGSDVWSCGISSDSSYRYLSGTSMATPHVAGALALAKAHFPGESSEDLITRLYTSADPLTALTGRSFTGGRLNLLGLLSASSPAVYHDDFDQPLWFYGCHGYWCGGNGRMTREPDEDLFSPDTGNKSMWFTWQAPASGLLTFRGRAGGAGGQVSVVAFKGENRNNLQRVADNFDQRPTSESRIFLYVEKDAVYRFSVDSKSPGGRLIIAELTLRPDNDHFLDARILASDDRFSDEGTTCGATAEPFERQNPHAGVGRGQSVWWRWTPDFDGDFVLTTRRSNFDTVLAVYSGPDSGNLTEVAANDDRSPVDWTSEVEFPVTAGTTYHIAVDTFRGHGSAVLDGYRKGALVILSHPEDVEVVAGRTADFEVISSQSELVLYQWFKDGTPVPGGTQSKLRISNVIATDFGDYHVEVSNGKETVASQPAALTELTLPPSILWQPTSLAYAIGEDLDIHPRVEGSEPLSYRWFKDGNPLPGEDGASLQIENLQAANQGYYQVEVSNAYGQTTSRFINVLVKEVPWSIWNWLEPQRPAYDLYDIGFAGDRFVAVGDAGTILSSPNAESWQNHTIADLNFRFKRVLHGNGRWLAADSHGHFAWSDDAETWNVHVESGWDLASSLFELFFWKGKFHHLHQSWGESRLYSSADGINWVLEHTFVSSSFSQAMTSPDMLVLVEKNTGKIWSSDNARDWTAVTPDGATARPAIWKGSGVYHDGEFRIWSSEFSSKRLWRSVDGLTWTSSDHNGESTWLGEPSDHHVIKSLGERVYYAEHRGLGDLGKRIKVSEDGILWEEHPLAFEVESMVDNGESVVAVGVAGHTATAPTWDLLDADVPDPGINNNIIDNIRVLDGRIWATTYYHTMFSSPDGTVWQSENGTSDNFPSDISFKSLVFAHGAYWTGARTLGSSRHIFRGLHPTQMKEVTESNLTGIYQMAAAGDRMVAFAYTSSRGFYYSDDGVDWSPATMPADGTNGGNSLRHLGGRFMALSGARILSSADGTSWTSYYTGARPGREEPEFLAHGLGQHLALSEEGDLWVSADGQSWSRRDISHLLKQFNDLFSGVVADGNSVAVFSENTGFYTEDLATWYEFNLPVTSVNHPVAFNGALVATTNHNGLPILLQGGRSDALAPSVAFANLVDGGRYFVNGRYAVAGNVFDPGGGTPETSFYVDGQLVDSSTDAEPGFTWTPREPGTVELKLVARNAAGLRSEARIAVTVVGTSPVGGVGLGNTHRVTASDGRLLLLGKEGTLGSSRDGTNWQRLSLPAGGDLDSVVYGSGAYVAGGDRVYVSTDGVNWTVIPDLEGRAGFDNGWFYVVGPDFLHISRDARSWRAVDPPSLHRSNSVAFFEGERIMLAGNGNISVSRNGGKLWTTTNIPGDHALRFGDAILSIKLGTIHRTVDWQSWQSYPAPSSQHRALMSAGGILFAGTASTAGNPTYGYQLGHYSVDGLNWQPVSRPPQVNAITHGDGQWIGFGYAAAYRSTDAVNWELILGNDGSGQPWDGLEGSPFLSGKWSVAFTAEAGFVAINENGLRATSPDGEQWTMSRSPAENGYGFSLITNLGDTFVAKRSSGGSNNRLPIWSTDLVEWQESDWLTEGEVMSSMKTVGSRVLATTAYGRFGISDDGRSWRVFEPGGRAWLYDSAEGGGTFAVLGDRVAHVSTDDGATWQSHTLSVRYKKIRYLNGEFLVYDSDGSLPLLARSADGATWQPVDSVKTGTSLRDVEALSFGNGTYLLSDTTTAVTGIDLAAWSDANLPTAKILKGTAFHPRLGFGVLTDGDGVLLSDDGNAWRHKPILTTLPQQIWPGAHGFFIASYYGVEALTRNDLEVVSLEPSLREAGVGQAIEIEVVLANRSPDPLDLDPITFEFFASRDGIVGNEDDFVLAEGRRTDAVLAGGESRTLSFPVEIPTEVAGGEFMVGVRVATPDHWIEANLANNTAHSGPDALFIPEWSLELLADGNGRINRDLSALRYPQGARVSLTATAGKGASFTGWSGDAVGAESQTTIVMDGDKSIQASFSSRVAMQVFTRGAGEVRGVADLGSYPVGSFASLTAVPEPGWEFTGWSGGASGSLVTTSVLMDAPKAVTAKFTLRMDSWKSTHFTPHELSNPAISSDLADPDRDGIPTWREYLHHSDPRSAASTGVLGVGRAGGFLYILFTRNTGAEAGFSLACQGSRNLADWNAPDLQERVLSQTNGVETVEVRLPVAGGPSGYLRLIYQDSRASP